LIRHTLPAVPLPIGSLAEAVTLPAGIRTLIAPIGCTSLNQPSTRSAGLTAIALPAVAVFADVDNGSATRPPAKTWPENSIARHPIPTHRIEDDRTGDLRLRRR